MPAPHSRRSEAPRHCRGSLSRTRRTAMANPVSSANLFGHPIHPMLIPFPIAFFVTTFASDTALWRTGNAAWATAATWLLGAGLSMAVLAALAGVTDFLGDARIRNIS